MPINNLYENAACGGISVKFYPASRTTPLTRLVLVQEFLTERLQSLRPRSEFAGHPVDVASQVIKFTYDGLNRRPGWSLFIPSGRRSPTAADVESVMKELRGQWEVIMGVHGSIEESVYWTITLTEN